MNWTSHEPLLLEKGAVLPVFNIAYQTWGRLSEQADNAVVVCHGLTGSADARDWWAPMFGTGKALDPTRDFIVCSNVLGGCYGSTGPTSLDPSGRRYGKGFPALTVRDQVRAQMRLMNALGVRGISMVVGGSMGGLQALEWALLDADRVRSLTVVAASPRHSAWCMSWNEMQRMALRTDPSYLGGDYAPDEQPVAGLGTARAIAMTSYRAPQALESRFGRGAMSAAPNQAAEENPGLAVQAWLRKHAESFVARFDANCYMTLIDAMDSHDVGVGRGGIRAALRAILQPALVVAISSDMLYPPFEQRDMSEQLPNAEFVELPSPHGHDGFLIDAALLEPHVARFRERAGTRPAVHRVRRLGGFA